MYNNAIIWQLPAFPETVSAAANNELVRHDTAYIKGQLTSSAMQ